MNSHYSMIIEWSDEDQCFVVSLPEWGQFCHTHGETYEAALENARAVLELLIASALEDGEPLPKPQRAYPTSFHTIMPEQSLQLAKKTELLKQAG